MKKTIQSIINDTLKSPNKKWSRKSLTMFVSFIMSVILGTYIVISHYFTPNPISPYAFDVFLAFLASSLGVGAMTLMDKFNYRKHNSPSTNEDESNQEYPEA